MAWDPKEGTTFSGRPRRPRSSRRVRPVGNAPSWSAPLGSNLRFSSALDAEYKAARPFGTGRFVEAPGGFEPPNGGFADLCLTTWLRRHEKNGGDERLLTESPPRAGNRTRTGDPNLGKVVLYQLSYSRKSQRAEE